MEINQGKTHSSIFNSIIELCLLFCFLLKYSFDDVSGVAFESVEDLFCMLLPLLCI